NILIQNAGRLTITGANRASITDASGGAADVVDIRNSSVTLSSLLIDGENGINNDAVDCEQGSTCTLIGNTIQGAAEPLGVYALSAAIVVGGILQNGTSNGIFAFGDVAVYGAHVRGSPVGITVRFGGRMRVGVVDPASFPGFTRTPTTIENNGAGVQILQAQ